MNDFYKVTPAMVEDEIAAEHYFTASEGILGSHVYSNYLKHSDDSTILEEGVCTKQESSEALEVLTICVIETINGFTFTGASSPVDPQDFNAELGRKYAREHAVGLLYSHLGFRLVGGKPKSYSHRGYAASTSRY